MKWSETIIETKEGSARAIAPEIISASRSTDIPALFSQWFINRLEKGYVKWINPFNQKPQYISFQKTRFIVFWSKNPQPLVPLLPLIDKQGMSYYFHFTLNDYTKELLEPNLPPLDERIENFISLSKQIGRERVIWRFDPLVLTNGYAVENLLNKIEYIGDKIAQYTEKLVFSFADISAYKKVHHNFKRAGLEYEEFTQETIYQAAEGISKLCRKWGISAHTCAEGINLSEFNIHHNKCIDDELILRVAKNDPVLRNLFDSGKSQQSALSSFEPKVHNNLKDSGQRKECGCVLSKDIGQYNTCSHLCIYCYANSSSNAVRKNLKAAHDSAESICE